jgi:predicted lactoylglutathione lyase
MPTQIFVNHIVKDLDRSKQFFEALGYSFNPMFTNEDAACLVISDTIFAMLHTPKSMERFLPKGKTTTDAHKGTESIIALSTDSRETVESIYQKAIAQGATEARPAEEYPFMYTRSFNHLDGHIWEVFHMDVSKFPKE